MTPASQSLVTLEPGQSAAVLEILLPADTKSRLFEMGLVVGTPVQLVRFGPLGDPVDIRLRGYHLTLSRHEAEAVLVQRTITG